MDWSKPSLLRDFILTATFIVIGLALVSLKVTYDTYHDQSESVVNQLETESTRIDRAMIIEIEHSSYLLQALGRQITHMDPHDLNGIATLLRSFDTTETLHNVFSWIDEDQNNVVSSNTGVHARPVDVSDRDYVKKAIADPWQIQIGRPIEGRVSEKWVLPVALGLTDSTGKYIGTILISMDVDTITRNLHKAVKESGISFAIYSNTLLPLTQSADENAALLAEYSTRLKTVDFSKYPSGVLSRNSLFGQSPLYVYYEVSANYPYIILLGLDSNVGAISIRSLLLPRLMQILLMGIFMLTVLWIVWLRILRPVSELSGITADVVRGNPYHPPLSGSAGEVVSLSQQIGRLDDYIREIRRIGEEQHNKNLMLRRAKESAELSNKIKIEFLTSMSHELRIPLNTITGFAEIMKNQLHGPLDASQYRQYAQNIHDGARHLQSLVDDVLALSNAEASMPEMQEKSVDVRFVLGKCLRMIAERLQQQKLHIELKVPDVLPRLRVDESRLQQILINLLLNAAFHSTEDSHIIAAAYLERGKDGGETFCISFTDFGSKSAPVGEGASRPQPRIRRHEAGNLGIPLTRALVAMHQARLDIESPPGKPTKLILRFPQDRIVY